MKNKAKPRNCIWIFVIIFSMILLITPIFAVWNDNNFDYRKQINITNVGNETLIDFPIYINISYETVMQNNYTDLRFVSGSCGASSPTNLSYEIEFNDSNHAVVWVKIPSLLASGTNICMYYGNSSITTTQAPASVWKSNYAMVYHMNLAGTDSTSNGRNKVSDVGTPTVDNTVLGYGTSFSANNAWSLTNLVYWEQQWKLRSHEILFTTSSDVNTRQTLFAEGGSVNGILMYILNGQLYARWWSESSPVWAGNHFNTSISANTTYHAVMHLTDTADYGLYLNGVHVANLTTPDYINAHSGNGGIGYTGTNTKDYHDLANSAGHYFLGSIHEFRAFDTAQSDSWINMSAQNMLNPTSTITINTQEAKPTLIQIDITNPSTSGVYSILQNNTFTLNGTITCNSKINGCGNITLNSEYNNSASTFSVISTFTGTTPMWTSSGQAKSCILNGGSNCNLSWIINATDPPGSNYKIQISGTSNLSEISPSASNELTIEIINGAAILFNQTTLDFGSFLKNSGTKNSNISVIASIQNNSNISVSCLSGNCSIITDNFPDGTNLNESSSKSFTFSCSDSTIGSFSATYGVVSNEDNLTNNIIVNCNVNRVFGPLNIVLNTPLEGSVKEVGQNKTFILEANVTCSGTCGNISTYAIFAQNFGDGSDGALTVTSLNTIVNNYTYLTATENSGQTILSVNDSSQFSIGNEILIIQMQNGSGSGSAGQYEITTISNTGVGTITIENAISNTYGSGTFGTTTSSVTQIVKIPQYTSVTINSGASITSPAWNGFDGGIVMFKVSGTLNTTGYINVSEKGYRGGDCNGCGNSAWGDQGESYLGIGIGTLNANANGGGGGYGPSGFNGDPGGGGGYGTAGGLGNSNEGNDATGGGIIGNSDLSKIFFGGGAGAGGDDDAQTPLPEYSDGGGIAIIFAQKIINARISSLGETGVSSGVSGAGTSGSGAGGSIWLKGNDITLNDVKALGGSSVTGTAGDIGGAGGDGRIRLDFNQISGSSSPSSGYNGSISSLFDAISTISGTTPLWTSSSQPQNCIIAEDGSCLFSWIINATGNINSSYNISVIAFSNYSIISSVVTGEVNVSIVDQLAPTITLLKPANNTKIISNKTINFIWTVSDDSTNLTCNFYLNGILNQTLNCTQGTNTTLTLTLKPAYYNWSVGAKDNSNLSSNSTTNYFTLIQNYNIIINKEITNLNTNQYFSNVKIINSVPNSTYNYSYIDFVETQFNLGSPTPLFNFFNLTSGPIYFGKTYVWKVNTTITNINYSIAGIGDYNTKDLFIVGGE